VSDFRIVDYDAIAMLNVSATQELARENEALKKRVAELEAKDRARDAKLAAIEKLLTSASTVMAQPAKPATANGQE
jgi:chaperonin cofactor prefoldin